MKALITFCILLVGQMAFGQNQKFHQLAGIIQSGINYPLSNVTITIYNNNKLYQTQTDSNGRYCIENIETGKYVVKAQYDGDISLLDSAYAVYDNSGFTTKNFNLNINSYYISCCYLRCGMSVSVASIPVINYTITAPNRNINTLAAYVRGVDSRNGETPSIKGGRPENTAYYIDGVRVAGMDENLTIIGR